MKKFKVLSSVSLYVLSVGNPVCVDNNNNNMLLSLHSSVSNINQDISAYLENSKYSIVSDMFNQKAANKIYVINGVKVSVSDFKRIKDECFSYTDKYYKKVWRKSSTSSRKSSTNILKDLTKDQSLLCEENLKYFISNTKVGSIIRICGDLNFNSHDGYIGNSRKPGHSLLIVDIKSTGFTTFDTVYGEKTWTFFGFANCGWFKDYGYKYIKYIQYGGKIDKYVQPKDVNKLYISNGAYNPKEIKYGKYYSLSGIIYAAKNDPINKVEIRVVDSKNKTVISASKKVKCSQFNIKELDNKIVFNKLKRGDYSLQIIVDTNSKCSMLVNNKFKVK